MPPPKDRQLPLTFASPDATTTAVVEAADAPPRRRSRAKLLEEALKQSLGEDIRVVLTDNRTSMLSQSP